GVAGTATGDSANVTLRVYAGTSVAGTLTQTLTTTRDGSTGNYSIDANALAPGTYTARAEQSDSAANVGYSTATTFTITAPDVPARVVCPAPPPGSSSDTTPTFPGTAGALSGDSTSVTIRVYSGTSVGGALVQSVTTTRSAGGAYSVDAAVLPAGTF